MNYSALAPAWLSLCLPAISPRIPPCLFHAASLQSAWIFHLRRSPRNPSRRIPAAVIGAFWVIAESLNIPPRPSSRSGKPYWKWFGKKIGKFSIFTDPRKKITPISSVFAGENVFHSCIEKYLLYKSLLPCYRYRLKGNLHSPGWKIDQKTFFEWLIVRRKDFFSWIGMLMDWKTKREKKIASWII